MRHPSDLPEKKNSPPSTTNPTFDTAAPSLPFSWLLAHALNRVSLNSKFHPACEIVMDIPHFSNPLLFPLSSHDLPRWAQDLACGFHPSRVSYLSKSTASPLWGFARYDVRNSIGFFTPLSADLVYFCLLFSPLSPYPQVWTS